MARLGDEAADSRRIRRSQHLLAAHQVLLVRLFVPEGLLRAPHRAFAQPRRERCRIFDWRSIRPLVLIHHLAELVGLVAA